MKFSFSVTRVMFLVVLAALCMRLPAQQTAGELLRNGTFEGGGGSDGRGGGVPEWEPFGLGYDVDRQNHHDGDQSIRCDSLNAARQRGAQIKVTLNQARAVPIVVSGWSKADQAQGVDSRRLRHLHRRRVYMDGYAAVGSDRRVSFGNARLAAAAGDASACQAAEVHHRHRPVSQSYRHGLVRRLFRAPRWKAAATSTGSRLPFPRFRHCPALACATAGKDGLALDVNAKGGIASVSLNGQVVSGGTGGFYLRDVGANGPLVPMHGVATPRNGRKGVNIGENVPELHVTFNARMETQGDAISVDGEITDLTKTDRAVSVYLALPVNARGLAVGPRHSPRADHSGGTGVHASDAHQCGRDGRAVAVSVWQRGKRAGRRRYRQSDGLAQRVPHLL